MKIAQAYECWEILCLKIYLKGARPRLDYVKQIVQEILLGLDFLHTRSEFKLDLLFDKIW